jgi:thiol:disulfide interchange protein DsbA
MMRSIIRVASAAALSLMAFACSAQDSTSKYVDGKHYKAVREPQVPVDPKRVEVAEFFWYGCPHCYAFDPTIEAWEKKRAADVDFVRYPATLGRPVGRMHAKAFYAAEALNVFDKMHPALFDLIQNKHNPLATDDQIAQAFSTVAGVMPDIAKSTLTGFAVDSRTRKAEQLAMAYGVTGVPTIIVGGKYTTSAAMAGGFKEVTEVIDMLVEKVRKERAKR